MLKPALNWNEIEWISKHAAPILVGARVDRIVVPERSNTPNGFNKYEWCLRLRSAERNSGEKAKEATCGLILSVRPQNAYFYPFLGKGPKAAEKATRTVFDLSVDKMLRGRKIKSIGIPQPDRCIFLEFEEVSDEPAVILCLTLIPAKPDAVLLEREAAENDDSRPRSPRWKVLASLRGDRKPGEAWSLPEIKGAPPAREIRPELQKAQEAKTLQEFFERSLRTDEIEHRRLILLQKERAKLKELEKALAKDEEALKRAENEADWSRWGILLKGSMQAPLVDGKRKVTDYEKDTKLEIPCDEKLSAAQQVEKFFSLDRRKLRRIHEAKGRIERYQEEKAESMRRISALELQSYTSIEELDSALRAPLTSSTNSHPSSDPSSGGRGSGKSPGSPRLPNSERVPYRKGWGGRTFWSAEGLMIWVGKSKDENAELTFRLARGNDIWLHAKGRPGSHVVIPLPPGRQASLETLLDAANLVIFYTAGKNFASWGKTEVDYAPKKNVKRIPGSSEASYTGNKTLMIVPDPSRIERLMKTADRGAED